MDKAGANLKRTAPGEIKNGRNMLIAFTLVCTFASAFISLFLRSAFSRNIQSRFYVIEENANRIAIRKTLTPPIPGTDELSSLDQALHQAATQINGRRDRELAILNKAADVLSSIDKQLRFTAVGASATSAWHYSPDDLLGRSLLTLLPAGDAAKLTADLEKLRPGSEIACEMVFHCGDGSDKDFLWKISKMDNGAFYCSARDITERRAVERVKQRLIAVASHDVRTPLSSISSALSLLQAGAYGQLSLNSRDALKRADANLERLMDLIRDLLELEKLESGKFSMQMACVSALDVCVEAIESLAAAAERASVTIVPPTGDASIKADERRVVQILINFIAQAMRNSQSGDKVALSIAVDDQFVRFTVSDSGPGMSDEDKKLIFEKFFQSKGDEESQASLKKSGLALAIARTLIEAHGGELGVDSKPGQGCRFWFTIPVFDAPDHMG